MATALKKPKAAAPEPDRTQDHKARRGGDGPFWAIFRFLASLKLAVVSLLTLALVLAGTTFCESQFLGVTATQEVVYKSLPFAILLAFLGVNILCAALIRYPWTKRQTGFVITHAGLLVVLAGSLVTARLGEEGRFSFVEDPKAEIPVTMIKEGADLIRVDEVKVDEKHQTKVVDGQVYSFRHGVFDWPEGSYQLLSGKDSPHKVAVKEFFPAAVRYYRHVPSKDGVPLAKFGVLVTPPGAVRPMDLFESDVYDREAWFQAKGRFRRQGKEVGGIRLAFQAVAKEDEQAFLADFLNPPKDIKSSAVRFRYTGKDGKARTFDWVIDPKGVTLPDSDLTVMEVAERAVSPTMFEGGREEEASPGTDVPVVLMKIKKGNGPEVEHWGLTAPKIGTFVPPREAGGDLREPLAELSYFPLPDLSGMVRGRVEVVATEGGRLFGRATNRSGMRPLGELSPGKRVTAFGGGTGAAMSVAFEVQDYLPAGREEPWYRPLPQSPGKETPGVPAALVELDVDGDRRDVWLTNLGGIEPGYQYVPLGRSMYRLSFDSERKPLGFKLALTDFQVIKEPGTDSPAEYQSDVLMTDEERGIKDRPVRISMNHPLEHRGYKLYQSGFQALRDDDDRPTGQYMSTLQIGYDPGRMLKYGGCILVVFGTFVQFYMRAGIFTDGGKLERARAEAKRKKAQGKAS